MPNSRPTGFLPGMDEVARLTRSGRLAEATGLVQHLLRGTGEPGPTAAPDPSVIEGEFTRLDSAPKTEKAPGNRPGHAARTGLGETLRGLAARLRPTGLHGAGMGAPRPPADPLPDGASFVTASHSGASGTRVYKLYVPANRGEGPRPLVVCCMAAPSRPTISPPAPG